MRSLREFFYPKFKIHKRARKLLIEYDGHQFKVLSNQVVPMAPPPSDPIANFENQTGAWVSVRDAHNKVLYRKRLPQAQLEGIEVFPSYPGEKLYWLKDSPTPLTLMVVIPDLPLAAYLDIYGSPRLTEGPEGEKGPPRPAAPLTTFSLKASQKPTTQGGTHGRQ
jgi:hypothetical protein